VVQIEYTHPDGRVEQVFKTSPNQSRKGAEEYERQLRASLLAGTYRSREEEKERPRTVRAFAKVYMEVYSANNNKVSWVTTKQAILDNHVLPFFGDKLLEDITVLDIERFKAAVRAGRKATKGKAAGRELSPGQINNALTVLRRMLTWAAETGALSSVPFIKFLKRSRKDIDALAESELEALVSGAEAEPEVLAAVLLAADAGLRMGEVLAMRWDALDLKKGIVHVRLTDYRGKVGTPKGGRVRHVPATERLVKALKAIRHIAGEWVFSPKVFPSTKRRRGTPERWTRGEIDARLWRACRRAGIREAGRHQLRHTFCSRLAAAGVPAPVIQRLAGHAGITTTQLYMHLSPGMNQERDAIAILSSANLARIAEGEAATGTN
jgi:integrase